MNLSKSVWAQAHLDDSTMRNGEPKTVPKLAQKSTPFEGVFLVFCSQGAIFLISNMPIRRANSTITSDWNLRNTYYLSLEAEGPLIGYSQPDPKG